MGLTRARRHRKIRLGGNTRQTCRDIHRSISRQIYYGDRMQLSSCYGRDPEHLPSQPSSSASMRLVNRRRESHRSDQCTASGISQGYTTSVNPEGIIPKLFFNFNQGVYFIYMSRNYYLQKQRLVILFYYIGENYDIVLLWKSNRSAIWWNHLIAQSHISLTHWTKFP